MNKLAWCEKQKNGSKLIQPNENLCKEYFQKAKNALNATNKLESNAEWQISTIYYSMYYSIYALVTKTGLKSENHSCSIQIIKELFKEYFLKKEILLLEEAQKYRIDAQYYVDRMIEEKEIKKLIKKSIAFNLKCREISITLNEEIVKKIREEYIVKTKKLISN